MSAFKGIGCLVSRLVLLALFSTIGWVTAAAEDAPVRTRIALLTDLHVTRGTNATQPFHRARFAKAVNAVNRLGVDLVLIAGDLTENSTDQEWLDFRRKIKALTVPVWFVPGNHDVGGKRISGAKGEVTFGSVVDYELKFGRSYFARKHAGVRVIGVNSALLGSGLVHEKRMWRMLEKALAKPSSEPTLLLIHHPLFVDKPDEKGGGYWNVEPAPRKRLLDLLQKGEVKAVLSGHLHHPVKHEHQGILFFTSSPVSFGLPRDKEPEGWNLLTVSEEGIDIEFQEIAD